MSECETISFFDIDEHFQDQFKETRVELMHRTNVDNWYLLTGLSETEMPNMLRLKWDKPSRDSINEKFKKYDANRDKVLELDEFYNAERDDSIFETPIPPEFIMEFKCKFISNNHTKNIKTMKNDFDDYDKQIKLIQGNIETALRNIDRVKYTVVERIMYEIFSHIHQHSVHPEKIFWKNVKGIEARKLLRKLFEQKDKSLLQGVNVAEFKNFIEKGNTTKQLNDLRKIAIDLPEMYRWNQKTYYTENNNSDKYNDHSTCLYTDSKGAKKRVRSLYGYTDGNRALPPDGSPCIDECTEGPSEGGEFRCRYFSPERQQTVSSDGKFGNKAKCKPCEKETNQRFYINIICFARQYAISTMKCNELLKAKQEYLRELGYKYYNPLTNEDKILITIQGEAGKYWIPRSRYDNRTDEEIRQSLRDNNSEEFSKIRWKESGVPFSDDQKKHIEDNLDWITGDRVARTQHFIIPLYGSINNEDGGALYKLQSKYAPIILNPITQKPFTVAQLDKLNGAYRSQIDNYIKNNFVITDQSNFYKYVKPTIEGVIEGASVISGSTLIASPIPILILASIAVAGIVFVAGSNMYTLFQQTELKKKKNIAVNQAATAFNAANIVIQGISSYIISSDVMTLSREIAGVAAEIKIPHMDVVNGIVPKLVQFISKSRSLYKGAQNWLYDSEVAFTKYELKDLPLKMEKVISDLLITGTMYGIAKYSNTMKNEYINNNGYNDHNNQILYDAISNADFKSEPDEHFSEMINSLILQADKIFEKEWPLHEDTLENLETYETYLTKTGINQNSTPLLDERMKHATEADPGVQALQTRHIKGGGQPSPVDSKYLYIVNPATSRRVSIFSKVGKKVLKNFVQELSSI